MPSWWAFAKDPEKRAIVSWIGGGAVVVAGALWTAMTFFVEHRDGREKSAETSAFMWAMQTQAEKLSELDRELKAQKAELNELTIRVSPRDLAAADPGALARLQELRRQIAPEDPQLEDIFTLSAMQEMKYLDQDIEDQLQRVNALQNSKLPSAAIDLETMRLKRLIDRRSQMFDAMRQIIDKYNQTAKQIIDSIGR